MPPRRPLRARPSLSALVAAGRAVAGSVRSWGSPTQGGSLRCRGSSADRRATSARQGCAAEEGLGSTQRPRQNWTRAGGAGALDREPAQGVGREGRGRSAEGQGAGGYAGGRGKWDQVRENGDTERGRGQDRAYPPGGYHPARSPAQDPKSSAYNRRSRGLTRILTKVHGWPTPVIPAPREAEAGGSPNWSPAWAI